MLMLSYAAIRRKPLGPYLPVLFLFGLLHGMAYAQEITLLELPLDQRLPALFIFNLALDAGQFGLALILVLITKFVKLPRSKTIFAYIVGGISVALILVLFQQHVAAGRTDLLGFASAQMATQYSLPISQKPQSGAKRPQGARRLTNPVMCYLTVEPYEVRQEILIQARAAVQLLGVDDRGKGSIPLGSLEPVKNGILEVVKSANPLSIDGQPAEPVVERADFVTLGLTGVMVRQSPVVESLDNGIIGLVLVYETPTMADEVTINWRLFSETVGKVEATTTDPFGGSTTVLSPDENLLRWKSRISGYRVPVIEKITVEKPRLPVVSLLLFLIGLLLFIVSVRRKGFIFGRPVLLSVIGLGFLLYPFMRVSVDLPFALQWKPSTERAAQIHDGLLTNVYRSFEVRAEEAVYDRLAVSVTGDQLTTIYLQNRRSMLMEERGGARARVEDVEVLDVSAIEGDEDGGFTSRVTWKVSGSVSHFGHTHYRQNRYEAVVRVLPTEGSWKIRNVEMASEERIL
jgi:hypothetical protein